MSTLSDSSLAMITAAVDAVMRGRHSTRAFLATLVPRELVDDVLITAARAPSGTNIQPWRVHVLTGKTHQEVIERVSAAFEAGDRSYQPEYDYYPSEFFEPYLGRRRKVGWDLYSLLGIQKGDTAAMKAQHKKNFTFFGAPVGLMFSIDRRMGQGSWFDYGMFVQNVMLAAQARGLATCPQAAWIDYHRIISETLGFGAEEQLVCGMALGYADPAAVVNTLTTERAALDEFVVHHSSSL